MPTETGKIKSYKDLKIWQRTKTYAIFVYSVTSVFPSEEKYGLSSQMRRAAVSMPSNIAEGFRKRSKQEKVQFLRMAYGSGAELETQLEISHDLGYVSDEKFKDAAAELDEIMKMINRAIGALEEK